MGITNRINNILFELLKCKPQNRFASANSYCSAVSELKQQHNNLVVGRIQSEYLMSENWLPIGFGIPEPTSPSIILTCGDGNFMKSLTFKLGGL